MNTQEVRGCSTSFLETPVMNGATTERAPTDRPGHEGNYGITYQGRPLWGRSAHSTQPLSVTAETRGRGTGRGTREHGCTGGYIRPRSTEVSAGKAVCIERCMHGLGRGRWKRAAFLILPAKGLLHRQVRIPSGTSPAAYFTILRMSQTILSLLILGQTVLFSPNSILMVRSNSDNILKLR
jgi:hypothetical protein